MSVDIFKKVLIYLIFTLLFIAPFYFSNKKDKNEKDQKQVINALKKKSEVNLGDMVFINIKKPFYIDRYEFPNEKGKLPVSGLDYFSAKKTCESVGKRLCSKEEWEYACKGKEDRRYSFAKEYSQFDKDKCNNLHQGRKLLASGSFKECRTKEGIYDLAGNLWEWVEAKDKRVFIAKGGSFLDGEISERCHVDYEIFSPQISEMNFLNFGARCCYSELPP